MRTPNVGAVAAVAAEEAAAVEALPVAAEEAAASPAAVAGAASPAAVLLLPEASVAARVRAVVAPVSGARQGQAGVARGAARAARGLRGGRGWAGGVLRVVWVGAAVAPVLGPAVGVRPASGAVLSAQAVRVRSVSAAAPWA